MAKKKNGIDKVRDIAFSKVEHCWNGKGYSNRLTPQEFKFLEKEGAINSAGDSWVDYCIERGISRKGIYWWEWTKKFSEAYWDWRTPRLGKGG